MSGDPAFLHRAESGVTIALKARPRARRNALDCSGGGALSAQVTAPAEDGQANRAIIDLLANEWRLPKSTFEVTKGVTGRDKVLSISGESAALAGRIAAWVQEQARHHG